MRSLVLSSLFSLLSISIIAQTTADDRRAGYERLMYQAESSIVGQLPFTNIGPTIMSGRVTDIAVNPEQPTHFYTAYASGGLWVTENNGTSFRPLFQQQEVMTIGAIDVNWNTGTVYLGSGEVNSSRSSYAGNGMWRSDDGGESWTHLGLEETHHIGRVIVDQSEGDTIWVAALGHLYTQNEERGVFRSIDGGKSWEKTLYIDERSGVVDLVRDPRHPNEFWAASWERDRKAWDFTEAGPGSGIWHSTDYGASWQLITGEDFDWPERATDGRLGLAVSYTAAGERRLYAALDNYARRPAEEDDPEVLTKNELKTMTAAEVQNLPDYQLEGFLRGNGFPEELTAELLRERLEGGSLTIEQMVNYLEDANRQLFDTPVVGLEVYVADGSASSRWTKTHEGYIESVYNSYGYYFGQIRVNPQDANELYVMGVPILRSTDGGASWEGVNAPNQHVDHHELWINPANPMHVINGNDGGVNISYDAGQHWVKCNTPSVGQFYTVAVDDHPDGYRVYGGLQDNGVWRGPHTYEENVGWHEEGQYPYERIMGGDGMQVIIDPRDNETLYTGFQFGNYFRINPAKGERSYITPKHELGERPYRWNWQSPIHLSVHNPDIVYFGSNHLHRSMNQGDDWTLISEDLTQGGLAGDVPYGTLATIHESPLRFGLLYTGSDDGLIYCSMDGGYEWQNVSEGLPADRWVSRVQASAHEEGRVYASLNGYRNDDFQAYVYRSEDYGKTWTAIGQNLPLEPVNVIKEDPVNPDLLYVGTDHGLYISLDGGRYFHQASHLPRVAVHDLAIQATANDLLVGTHGRSFYRADLEQLQQLSARNQAFTVFEPAKVRASSRWGRDSWFGDTEPELEIPIYAPAPGQMDFKVQLKDGPTVYTGSAEVPLGLSHFSYNLSIMAEQAENLEAALQAEQEEDERPIRVKEADSGKYYLAKGTYVLYFSLGGEDQEVELEVR
ncbi:MAG: glycosyl hydrolase [Bacteroidota bacterium]